MPVIMVPQSTCQYWYAIWHEH